MSLVQTLLGAVFGNGRNALAETAEIFRVNSDKEAARGAAYSQAALAQFAAEFGIERKGWFDRFIDGLNRLPRPLMALGTIGLITAAMFEPVWFAERMPGLALVPEQLWWLMGAVVAFYFGARSQAKEHDLQSSMASSMARVSSVVQSIDAIRTLRPDSPGAADPANDASASIAATEAAKPISAPTLAAGSDNRPDTGNAALDDGIVAWRSKTKLQP